MNMLKRTLAMFLVLCMMIGAMPFAAFADETDGTIVTEPQETVEETTEAPSEGDNVDTTPTTEAPSEGDNVDTTPTTEAPSEGDDVDTTPTTEAPSEAVDVGPTVGEIIGELDTIPAAEDDAADVNCVPTTEAPSEDDDADNAPTEAPEEEIATAGISSITMGTKPVDGTTKDEPFPYGTAGSNSFRIPALVTLSDGTMVAAADARWNTTYDGGGLDTIVSYSTDGGATWHYTFANYLGDHGNEYNGSQSTAFIDPALTVVGDTVYMLVDLYPYGVALNGSGNTHPSTATGFNDDGKLLLSANNHQSYDFYLDGDTIYSKDGTPVEGYTVDAYFNITEDSTSLESNLFFSNSPYKVVRTGFLYLTKSSDGGKTWSEPELLNLKNGSEQVCLVAPGRGLVTGNDNVVFPVYSYHYNNGNAIQYMGYISFDGNSWSRGPSMTNGSWSSESAVVALEDGTLRFFYRNGSTNLCYVDYYNGWSTPVLLETIDTNSNCQISAITYSKTIDGKQVILVSCPTGPEEAGSDQSGASYRLNGKIFAFTVGEDKLMTKVAEKNVTSNEAEFMYSCLTELADGTVAILYEDHENEWGAGIKNGKECYYSMSFATYDLAADFGLTFDVEEEPEDPTEPSEPEVPEDETVTDEVSGVVITAPGLETVKVDAQEAKEEDGVVTKTYAISLNGGAYTAAATVKIPYDAAFDGCNTFVGYVDGDEFPVKKQGGFFICEVPHFSDVQIRGTVTVGETVTVRIPVDGTSELYTINDVYLEEDEVTGLDTTVATAKFGGQAGSEGTVNYDTATNVTNGTLLNQNATTQTATGYYYKTNNSYYPLYATRESNGNSRYNYVWYYSTDNGKSFTQCGSETRVRSSATPSITVYTKSGTEGISAYTTVTFTGVKAGNTTAMVGTTKFNITVYEEVEIQINYTVDGKTVATGTVKAPSDAVATDTVSLPASVAGTDGNTYKVNSTTLTLDKGVNATYSVEVTLVEGTEITIAEKESVVLDLTITNGQYVMWTTEDSSKVAVSGQYNAASNAYTGDGIILGHNATEANSPVLVTGTVYNANGSVYGIHKWLVTVTDVAEATGKTVRYKLDIKQIENCTVYYSINGGELIEIKLENLEKETDENGNVYYIFMEETFTTGTHITFLAKPDEGYALTYMAYEASGSSQYQYFTMSNGNPDGTGSDAWPFDSASQTTIPNSSGDGAWKNQSEWYSYYSNLGLSNFVSQTSNNCFGYGWALYEKNMTIDQWKMMMSNAYALGCDGAMLFTKNGSNENFEAKLYFAAEALPTFDKTVDGVLPASRNQDDYRKYADGMVTTVGEQVYFKITVTQQMPIVWTDSSKTIGSVKYTDAIVEDTILSKYNAAGKPIIGYLYDQGLDQQDGKWDGAIAENYRVNTSDITDKLNAAWTTAEKSAGYRTIDLYLVYDVTNEDIGLDSLYNEAKLSFNYRSSYSSGISSQEADAAASIDIMGKLMESIVIDFGLPVTYSGLTADELGSAVRGEAKFGDVIISNNSVTYTPNQILKSIDTVALYDKDNNLVNAFMVYPATSVYYEEGFLFADQVTGKWDGTDNKGNGTQTALALGAAVTEGNVFGYDAHYATHSTGSDASAASSEQVGAKTVFTFTGTGFELYANSNSGSGYVTLYNEGGDLSKIYMINTKLTNVDGADIANTTYYSLPIISEKNLEHGTYTVYLMHTNDTNPIYIDGIRILNTLEDSTVFTADEEDNPVFYELRDYVLNAIGVESLQESDYIQDGTSTRDSRYKQVSDMAGQVYNAMGEGTKAVIINERDTTFTDEQAQKLLDNGPKNELYLYPGQTLAFSINTNRVLQLGLKAPTGNAEFTLTVDNKTLDLNELSSTVDMFYKIAAKQTTASEHVVSITVSEGVLSVTSLKVCDDPTFGFNDLTKEDIEEILKDIFGLEDEEEPETPEETTQPTEPETPEETTQPTDPETPEEPTKPEDPEEPDLLQRIYGDTRYYTAIEIANQLKKILGVSKFDAIVVASGTDFADALSGTYLANQKGAPVLLVRNRDQEMNLVKDYIKANLVEGGTVYILGGEKAVPKAMETGLEGFNVKRLGGATRYETNLLILKEAGVKAGEDILVCTGKDFPDSLAASAVNKPIVLVKDSLSTTQQQYLNSVKGGKLYIIGGTAAVNTRIEAALKDYGTTQRLSGATRYDTSVEIAKTFFADTDVAVVAYGENFPDGMCGGTLAYSMGAPVLLTTNSKSATAASYTTANGIHNGAVLGGTKLISDSIVAKIFK